MRRYAVLILLMLALGACELFKVRDAELPSKPPLWNTFTTRWEDCVQNLEYCYNDARNLVKYAGIFTADYRFSFAAQDINDYGISGAWTRANEQDMLISLHGQCDSLRLELYPIEGQSDDISATAVVVSRYYRLEVFKKNSTAAEQYAGNLQIHLKRQIGYWYIDKWHDYRSSGTEPSWGKLKYDNSQ